MSNNNSFAFGDDTVNKCDCPAVSAGFSVSHSERTVAIAGEYDDVIRKNCNMDTFSKGIICESTARSAWMEGIRQLKTMYPDDHPKVEVAEQIAAELGWENDST